jgi:O-antigen/teichoic acid export membrane protein
MVLLGQKWEGAIGALTLLCLYACVRAVMPLVAQVLLVVGESNFVMWNSIASLMLLPLAFLAGSRWGPAGIAAAWVMAYPLNAVPLYIRLKRRIALDNRECFAAVWPALSGVIAMTAVVAAVKMLLAGPFQVTAAWRLVIESATGAVAYASMLLLFHRPRVSAFRRAMLMLRG